MSFNTFCAKRRKNLYVPRQITRRTAIGSALGVLALTACGAQSDSTGTTNEILDLVTEKQRLLAQLQQMNRAAAKTIAEHQQAHLAALSSYCDLPSAVPSFLPVEPSVALTRIVSECNWLIASPIDDELRRILLLVGASDTVHLELLRTQG